MKEDGITVVHGELWNSVYSDYEKYFSYLNTYLNEVSRELHRCIKESGISCIIKCRIKERESYYAKLKKQSKQSGADNVHLTDLMGIRIIVHFLEDVDAVSAIINNNYTVLELENKAAGLSFREFSYDSTHLLIEGPDLDASKMIQANDPVIEVQVRTTLQDAWAEVEHGLIYKSHVQYPSEMVKRKMASLNAILSLADVMFQEIKDYQADLLQNKDDRTRLMHEKASQLSSEEIQQYLAVQGGTSGATKPKRSIEHTIHKALQAHSAGKYAEALDFYNEAISMNPKEAILSVLYNHRGMTHFMNSNYNKAFDDFTYAISHNSDNHRSYTNRGIINRIFKRIDAAHDDFSSSLEINHNQPDVWMHLAQTRMDQNNLTGALQAVDTVLALAPDLEEAVALKQRISKKLIP